MPTVLFDYDPILYTAGSVGEKRHIKVVHRQSGDEWEFKTRTEFYGHHKQKKGGWLAQWNADKADDLKRSPEDFDITDVQVPEPFSNAAHTVKRIIASVCESVGGSPHYYGYSGKGTVFREDVSTVIKYKGNRENSLRPVLLDELKDYLVMRHRCEIITGIEADDACSIDSYTAWPKYKKSGNDADKLILACVDKDYLQCDAHIINISNLSAGVDSFSGLGSLWRNEKGDVKGRGRMWLYYQTLYGDHSDNYFAASASGVKWGEVAAFSRLKDAQSDKEAWEALVAGYKFLYPSPKTIIGWRGDPIEVDWLSMLQENFTLARMLRWKNDNVSVVDVLRRLNVSY
jgi:hypothetical protein